MPIGAKEDNWDDEASTVRAQVRAASAADENAQLKLPQEAAGSRAPGTRRHRDDTWDDDAASVSHLGPSAPAPGETANMEPHQEEAVRRWPTIHRRRGDH